ncbi:MAG: pentapeptide repeat-containing protein, partial [Candidatus Nanopelagicales bacterium]
LGDNPENFFDAFAIHTYPKGSAGATYKDNCQVTTTPFDCIDTLDPRAAAAQRFDDIRTWQQKVVEQVGALSPVLDKGLWDTEVNYGLAGPGINPPVDWSDAQGAELISYTYADSRALGIDATFWYEFTAAPYDLLGVQLTPQTPLTQAAYSALPLTPTGTSGQNPTEISVGNCVIEPSMQCPGAKLRELDVSGMSFRGVDLTNTDLRKANLNNSGFGNAGITKSNFSDADVRNANLQSADFRGADLSDADLRNADLRKADLRSADLTSADFRGADLRGAFLGDSKVRGANFRGADLRGATLYTDFTRNANLVGARR